MRLGIMKDIDWAFVGAMLARDDDKNQIAFFKTFVKECKTWGTTHQVESQLAMINLGLTKEERETLYMLGFEEENK